MKLFASINRRLQLLKTLRFPAVPIALALLVLGLTIATTAFAAGDSENVDPDANYDRMDGTGKSGKRVDVIEWEDNLEIHVYPKGSVSGLGFVLDEKTNKGKKVMVISYRFNTAPKTPLIRRAILGIPLKAPFNVYKDSTEQEFDKIVLSNNTLSGSLVAFKTDPEPTQLFPDGHPAIAQAEDSPGNSPKGPNNNDVRTPANTAEQPQGLSFFQGGAKAPAKKESKPVETKSKNNQTIELDDSGSIKPFFME